MIKTPATPTRTAAQTRDRRRLADHATGRTAVLLYLSEADPSAPTVTTLPTLLRYAAARDWVVVRAVYDPAPLDLPLAARQAWTESVVPALQDATAEGVVALAGHVREHSRAEAARLAYWLDERGAFLATAPRVRGVAPRTLGRTATSIPEMRKPAQDGRTCT